MADNQQWERRQNVFKILGIIMEVAGKVFTVTLEHLFPPRKEGSIETNLKTVLGPDCIQKSFNKLEKEILEGLANGTRKLDDLDVSFLLKLIFHTCNIPDKRMHYKLNAKLRDDLPLMHCLRKIKEERNKIIHEYRHLLKQTAPTEDIRTRMATIEIFLQQLIEKVSLQAKLSNEKKMNWLQQLSNDLTDTKKLYQITQHLNPNSKMFERMEPQAYSRNSSSQHTWNPYSRYDGDLDYLKGSCYTGDSGYKGSSGYTGGLQAESSKFDPVCVLQYYDDKSFVESQIKAYIKEWNASITVEDDEDDEDSEY